MELEGSSRASRMSKVKHIAGSWELYAKIFLIKIVFIAVNVLNKICVNYRKAVF
jgi:hypothetical protein